MQDFAAELQAARHPLLMPDMVEGQQRVGGFEGYLVGQAVNRGFELGYEAGDKAAWDRARPQMEAVREQARLDGFDAGARVVLRCTLTGLQEVVGEFESRRAHKVMLVKARERLGELVEQLSSVHDVLPPATQDLPGQEQLVAFEEVLRADG